MAGYLLTCAHTVTHAPPKRAYWGGTAEKRGGGFLRIPSGIFRRCISRRTRVPPAMCFRLYSLLASCPIRIPIIAHSFARQLRYLRRAPRLKSEKKTAQLARNARMNSAGRRSRILLTSGSVYNSPRGPKLWPLAWLPSPSGPGNMPRGRALLPDVADTATRSYDLGKR